MQRRSPGEAGQPSLCGENVADTHGQGLEHVSEVQEGSERISGRGKRPSVSTADWWSTLNPTVGREWLMGFPLGWTVLDASETPSSRRSRKKSAK